LTIGIFAVGFWLATWTSQATSNFWLAGLVFTISSLVSVSVSRSSGQATRLRILLTFVLLSGASLYSQVHGQAVDQSVLEVASDFEIHELDVHLDSCSKNACDVTATLSGNDFAAKLITTQLSGAGYPLFDQGDTIRGEFRLKPDRRRAGTVMLVPQDEPQIVASGSTWQSELRRAFVATTAGLNPDAAALVIGLTIGDDSSLSETIKSRMKTLSLTHLTAVSGANCAIVVGAVFVLLKRFGAGRKLSTAAGLCALGCYVLIVGNEPSVLRAAMMAGIVILCSFGGRRVAPIASLSWAVIFVLLFWPSMAASLGFALSVAATSAILLLSPAIFERLSRVLPKPLAISLSVILAAQLWCLPFLVALNPTVPTYGVVANLIAEPLVAPVTVLGVSALAVCAVAPWLASMLSFVASCLTNIIIGITGMAELEGSTVALPRGALGLAILCGCVISISWLLLRSSKLALSALLCCVLIWLFSGGESLRTYHNWPPRDWEIVACDVGQGDGLVYRSYGRIAVIDVGRDPQPIDSCLTQLGITHIDLLVLTHFDADHVGGLGGAIDSRTVDVAFISPFKDQRPLAKLSRQMLSIAAEDVVEASCCMVGKIGSAEWHVLQPEPDAALSEDSNDASIVMRFDTSEHTLFTLADAGERAQMRLVSEHPGLLFRNPMSQVIVKVSHHGSGDQYPELQESLGADLAIFSVGAKNPYGHPTRRTLGIFERTGTKVVRTDQVGSIAVSSREGRLSISVSGEG
jgi:competence protein ComEC